jgi:hypothetical protein
MKKLFILFAILLLAVFVHAEEDIDTTLAQYDEYTLEQEQATLEEIEVIAQETEVEIAEELLIESEILEEYQEVSESIGPKQYILNRQLKHKIQITLLKMDIVIRNLQDADTTELEDVRARVQEVYDNLDQKTLGEIDFREKAEFIKGLVTEFRVKSVSLLTDESKSLILEEIENEVSLLKEDAYTKLINLHNRLRINNALNRVRQDAVDFQQNNDRLLQVRTKLENLRQLRESYSSDEVSREDIENFGSEWREQVRTYQASQSSARELGRRAQIYRQALNESIPRERLQELQEQLQDVDKDKLHQRIQNFRSSMKPAPRANTDSVASTDPMDADGGSVDVLPAATTDDISADATRRDY